MQTPMLDQQSRFRTRGAFAVLLGALALLAVCFSQSSAVTGWVAAVRTPATVNSAMRGQPKYTHVWPSAGLVTPRKGDVSMMIDQAAAELGVTADALAPAVQAAQQSLAATNGDFHTAVQVASSLLASNAGDFGGYTIPIVGLATLAATIGILAGPVED